MDQIVTCARKCDLVRECSAQQKKDRPKRDHWSDIRSLVRVKSGRDKRPDLVKQKRNRKKDRAIERDLYIKIESACDGVDNQSLLNAIAAFANIGRKRGISGNLYICSQSPGLSSRQIKLSIRPFLHNSLNRRTLRYHRAFQFLLKLKGVLYRFAFFGRNVSSGLTMLI